MILLTHSLVGATCAQLILATHKRIHSLVGVLVLVQVKE